MPCSKHRSRVGWSRSLDGSSRGRDVQRLRRSGRSWAFLALLLPATLNVAAAEVSSPTAAPSIGSPPGLRERAVAYEHGEGVPKDLRAAALLYCEAARSGDAEAAYGLGWMYANGRGVARDDAAAAALFSLARQGGHEQARNLLAVIGSDPGALPDCMRPPVPDEEPPGLPTTESVPAVRPVRESAAVEAADRRPGRAIRAALRRRAAAGTRRDRRGVQFRPPRDFPEGRARADAAHSGNRDAIQRQESVQREREPARRTGVPPLVAGLLSGQRRACGRRLQRRRAGSRQIRRRAAVRGDAGVRPAHPGRVPSARHVFDSRIAPPSPMLSRSAPASR